jgi:hypothetical protein
LGIAVVVVVVVVGGGGVVALKAQARAIVHFSTGKSCKLPGKPAAMHFNRL